MAASTLLLDIGNTATKGCLYDGLDYKWLGTLADSEVGAYLPKVGQVVFACVGDRAFAHVLARLCARHSLPLKEATVEPLAFDVRCGYDNVSSLGVDRWLAVLGARQFTENAFAVLDFGTATTCDFVDDQRHHAGGWIVPGVQAMRRALIASTQNVSARDDRLLGLVKECGDNTLDCVDSGCWYASVGVLQQADGYCARHFANYELFVTGGDGDKIVRSSPIKAHFDSLLVFRGLALFASDAG